MVVLSLSILILLVFKRFLMGNLRDIAILVRCGDKDKRKLKQMQSKCTIRFSRAFGNSLYFRTPNNMLMYNVF